MPQWRHLGSGWPTWGVAGAAANAALALARPQAAANASLASVREWLEACAQPEGGPELMDGIRGLVTWQVRIMPWLQRPLRLAPA